MPKENYKIKFIGSVTEGKLTLEKQAKFKEYLHQFEGKKVELTVRKEVKRRSSPQLRYYFGVCVSMVKEAFKELGDESTAEQVHEFLKSQFLFKELVNEKTAEIYRVPLSMSDKGEVSTDIMSEYINKIQRWAITNLGVYIPDPNEDFVVDERFYQD